VHVAKMMQEHRPVGPLRRGGGGRQGGCPCGRGDSASVL
jgi:hypothetical protein